MAWWRSGERGQAGDSCLLRRKGAEPRFGRSWEKTPMKPTPQWLWQWEADLPEGDGAKGGNLASEEHQCLCRKINNPAHNIQLCQNALSLCSSRHKQQHSSSILGILSSKSQPEYLQQSIRLCLGDSGVGFILAGVLGSTQKQLLQTGHLDTAVEITI